MARSLRPLTVFPITTRTLEVLRVTDVTPGMRRVTLGGPELAAHVAENGFEVAEFRSEGFDDEFKILLRHPQRDAALGPTQADGLLRWPRGDEHLIMRTYTVRRWDAAAGEIDIDFVVHGIGPATSWARTVQPGERMQVAGPKLSARHPEGADWTLVAGDETALPAIARWLEEWPAGARGQVFIEVAEAAHYQDLVHPEGVEITWLSRDGAAAGTTTLLLDAIGSADWWDGTPFVWVAGETLTLTPIRRLLRGERGLPKEQVEITGYWRRQQVVRSVVDDTAVDVDATTDDGEAIHELSEIAPGFALRVAATIGLGDAFGGEARALAELAEVTAASPSGLLRLLRYLEAIGVVERAPADRYRLTPIGRGLENENLADHLNLEGAAGQRELAAMLELLDAVRDPDADRAAPEYAARFRDDPARLAEQLEDDAADGVYVAGALASAVDLRGVAALVASGTDAGGFAAALVAHHPKLAVRVLAAPSELEIISRLHSPHPRVSLEAGSLLSRIPGEPDAVLLADTLRELSDADAVHVLRTAAASVGAAGRLLLFSETLIPEAADDHDYAEDLIAFALYRGGLRTHAEHHALFAAAGLPNPDHQTIGWGYSLFTSAGGLS